MELKHLTPVFSLSNFVQHHLNSWYSKNKRPLPWRNNNDPYQVWLSEIILQQTRVEQGLPYYIRFLEFFPSVHDLAAASEEQVLKLWQGLGYYSRARNLHKAAKQVSIKFDGRFPDNYNDLLTLKGVGPYSAAAIASICFNEPVAVVDGNVHRFLGRLFAIEKAVDTSEGKKYYQQVAQALLDKNQPGDFNQAMMEFGATVCTPRQPKCIACPLSPHCAAKTTNRIGQFPVKARSTAVKPLFMHYFVIRHNGGIYLQKRSEHGIWANMYEFPAISSAKEISPDQIKSKTRELGIPEAALTETSKPIQHLLTHRRITAQFSLYNLQEFQPANEMIFVPDQNSLKKFALPKPIERYLSSPIFQKTDKIVT